MEDAFSEYSFGELEINNEIKRSVQEMGFEKMTPIQAQAIPVLLSGRDVIGQAQTGTGKTAAFGIPILNMVDPNLKKLQAIILCPTRELAVQATGELRSFAKYMQNVKLLPVYGGQDINIQIKGLKGVQIIVGTPGRVMDHMRRHTIKMDNVKMVVLDEADEMLDMGFREDMEVILGAIENQHQTCMFSATMPPAILELTGRYQQNPEYIKITKKELTIDRIKQYYYPVKQEFKALALSRLLKYYNYDKCIIFCNTKGMVDELSASLQREGYTADGLHGDLTQKQRDSVMGRFRSGSVSILIATDIAARGIDVDDVEAVFNFDIPLETEYYVHRIGRTGRAGRVGTSHTLCRSKDFGKIHDIERTCHATMEEKRIPSVEDINNERENVVLARIKDQMAAGVDERLADMICRFCDDNDVEIEDFAAVLLKREIGSLVENESVEINLPGKKGKQSKSDRKDRFYKKDRSDKKDKFEKRDRSDKKDRFEKRDRSDKKDKLDKKDRSDKKDKLDKKDRFEKRNKSGNKDKSEKKRNRERSKEILTKAVKDVRMNGSKKK